MIQGNPYVDIIGAGNLAWSLAPALENAGFKVNFVYSRTIKNAKKLARLLYQAEPKLDLDFSLSRSSIFILAVSDDALDEVAREIVLPLDAVIAHTSGSKPISTLAYTATPNIGVFYPLQTFSRQKLIDFKEVPILIEADNGSTKQILIKLGKSISRIVLPISSEQRKIVHLAAVFACNFTNDMLSEASILLNNSALDFNILKPLIVETINKSLELGPVSAQTGPARRGDLKILDEHMNLLAGQKELQEIYRLISQNIIDKSNR
jgi:predicted short-subunit dehydrogenase-like oxidoreductase (DUF2520 family)